MRSGGIIVPEGLLGLGRKASFRRGAAGRNRRRGTNLPERGSPRPRRPAVGRGFCRGCSWGKGGGDGRLGRRSAGEDGEDVVAAVAAEDPVGFDAEQMGGAVAESGGERVGIFLQAGLDGAADGALDGGG